MTKILSTFFFIYLFLQSLADTINKLVYLNKSSIITLILDYTEYWKERRGARLRKLILCPLKFKYEQELEIFFFLNKSEGKNDKIAHHIW